SIFPSTDGPSWKEVPGWSFHGGSGGLRQGEHIIDLVDLSLFPDDASVRTSVFGSFASSIQELTSVVLAHGGQEVVGPAGQPMLELPAKLPSLFGLNDDAFPAGSDVLAQMVGLRQVLQGDPTKAKLDRAYTINDSAPLTHNRMFIPEM